MILNSNAVVDGEIKQTTNTPEAGDNGNTSLEKLTQEGLETALRQGLKLPLLCEPSSNLTTHASNTNEKQEAEPGAALYYNHFVEQEKKIKDLEEQLKQLTEDKKNLQTKLVEETDKKIVLCEPHPFHEFTTVFDEYDSDVAEDAILEASDDEEKKPSLNGAEESIPESPSSPSSKRRRVSAFLGRDLEPNEVIERDSPPTVQEEVENNKPKKISRSKRSTRTGAQIAPGESTAEDIPTELGNLDCTKMICWNGNIYATSKAFHEKGRLQTLKERYEREFGISSYIIVEGDELKRLKSTSENVAGHTRQLYLFTMPFIHYFIGEE